MVQGDIRKIVREIKTARPSGREFLILTGRKKQNVSLSPGDQADSVSRTP